MYAAGCGLAAVLMSWSSAEYLHLVLARSNTRLPPAALSLVRYQKVSAVLFPAQIVQRYPCNEHSSALCKPPEPQQAGLVASAPEEH